MPTTFARVSIVSAYKKKYVDAGSILKKKVRGISVGTPFPYLIFTLDLKLKRRANKSQILVLFCVKVK